MIFVLGYVENKPEEKWVGLNQINRAPALALLEKFNTVEKADAALAELASYWENLLSHHTEPYVYSLMIDPCIPKNLKGFEVARTFRGIDYHIEVLNPEHVEKGIAKLIVDGKEVSGNTIPFDSSMVGKSVHVTAVMG